MTGPAIELQKVSKSYRSHERFIEALADISLCIDPGEFVLLVGPSGSGKTTLLNLISALDQADTGTVVVAGQMLGAQDLGRPPASAIDALGLFSNPIICRRN
jgi:putative ABC transport system ATP-binding protein